jgi:tetratricopeptide (TPR) repeat protein
MMVALAAAGWGMVRPARADEILVGRMRLENVRITNIADGVVEYYARGGRRTRDLESISGIRLERYPAYGQAVERIEQAPAEAAESLRDLLNKVREDHLRPLFRIQLCRALDQSGDFGGALGQYLEAIAADPSVYYLKQAPRNYPKDAARRAQAAKRVREAAAESRSNTVRLVLDDLAAKLEGKVAPDAPQAADGDEPTTDAHDLPARAVDLADDQGPDPDVYVNRAVRNLVEAGRFDQAIEQINQRLDDPRIADRARMIGDLYYQRGQAEAAMGQPVQAAGSYLRVAIHYPDHRAAAAALEQAGDQLARAGLNDAAQNTYQRAMRAADNPQATQRIQRSLDQLPEN